MIQTNKTLKLAFLITIYASLLLLTGCLGESVADEREEREFRAERDKTMELKRQEVEDKDSVVHDLTPIDGLEYDPREECPCPLYCEGNRVLQKKCVNALCQYRDPDVVETCTISQMCVDAKCVDKKDTDDDGSDICEGADGIVYSRFRASEHERITTDEWTYVPVRRSADLYLYEENRRINPCNFEEGVPQWIIDGCNKIGTEYDENTPNSNYAGTMISWGNCNTAFQKQTKTYDASYTNEDTDTHYTKKRQEGDCNVISRDGSEIGIKLTMYWRKLYSEPDRGNGPAVFDGGHYAHFPATCYYDSKIQFPTCNPTRSSALVLEHTNINFIRNCNEFQAKALGFANYVEMRKELATGLLDEADWKCFDYPGEDTDGDNVVDIVKGAVCEQRCGIGGKEVGESCDSSDTEEANRVCTKDSKVNDRICHRCTCVTINICGNYRVENYMKDGELFEEKCDDGNENGILDSICNSDCTMQKP